MKQKNVETDYCCPICDVQLRRQDGEQSHPGNPDFGVTMFCSNTKCSAQECSGHGKNDKEAYSIILAKFTGKRQTETEE